VGKTAQISAREAAMQTEMRETRIQPQRMVTDWPLVRVMYSVVLRPKGTAMMAKERPRMDIMDRWRGSSDL
jgi:hypothetical protein